MAAHKEGTLAFLRAALVKKRFFILTPLRGERERERERERDRERERNEEITAATYTDNKTVFEAVPPIVRFSRDSTDEFFFFCFFRKEEEEWRNKSGRSGQ